MVKQRRSVLNPALYCQGLSINCSRPLPPRFTQEPRTGPYNRAMLHSLNALLAPAVMQRLVLVINHVLSAEPAATRRLQAHAQQVICVQMDHWPALLPAPPVLAFRLTPAGMLEWCGDAGGPPQPDLLVRVQAGNPLALVARSLGGDRPSVDIEGNAQLAADVNWLLQNLRWDVAADLERSFGPAVAYPLHRLGSALANGLRSAMAGANGLNPRSRPPTP